MNGSSWKRFTLQSSQVAQGLRNGGESLSPDGLVSMLPHWTNVLTRPADDCRHHLLMSVDRRGHYAAPADLVSAMLSELLVDSESLIACNAAMEERACAVYLGTAVPVPKFRARNLLLGQTRYYSFGIWISVSEDGADTRVEASDAMILPTSQRVRTHWDAKAHFLHAPGSDQRERVAHRFQKWLHDRCL